MKLYSSNHSISLIFAADRVDKFEKTFDLLKVIHRLCV